MSAHNAPWTADELTAMSESMMTSEFRSLIADSWTGEAVAIFPAATPQGGDVAYRTINIPQVPVSHPRIAAKFTHALRHELESTPLQFNVCFFGDGEPLGSLEANSYAEPHFPGSRKTFAYLKTWLGFLIGMVMDMRDLATQDPTTRWPFSWDVLEADKVIAEYVKWIRHLRINWYNEGLHPSFLNDTVRSQQLVPFLRNASLHIAISKVIELSMTLPSQDQMGGKWMATVLRDLRYFADNDIVEVKLVCDIDLHNQDCGAYLWDHNTDGHMAAFFPIDDCCPTCTLKYYDMTRGSCTRSLEIDREARFDEHKQWLVEERTAWTQYLDANKGKLAWEWSA